MPGFCYFWRYTPAEFDALSFADQDTLAAWQAMYERQMQSESERLRAHLPAQVRR